MFFRQVKVRRSHVITNGVRNFREEERAIVGVLGVLLRCCRNELFNVVIFNELCNRYVDVMRHAAAPVDEHGLFLFRVNGCLVGRRRVSFIAFYVTVVEGSMFTRRAFFIVLFRPNGGEVRALFMGLCVLACFLVVTVVVHALINFVGVDVHLVGGLVRQVGRVFRFIAKAFPANDAYVVFAFGCCLYPYVRLAGNVSDDLMVVGRCVSVSTFQFIRRIMSPGVHVVFGFNDSLLPRVNGILFNRCRFARYFPVSPAIFEEIPGLTTNCSVLVRCTISVPFTVVIRVRRCPRTRSFHLFRGDDRYFGVQFVNVVVRLSSSFILRTQDARQGAGRACPFNFRVMRVFGLKVWVVISRCTQIASP